MPSVRCPGASEKKHASALWQDHSGVGPKPGFKKISNLTPPAVFPYADTIR
jgi:hypothetical protein